MMNQRRIAECINKEMNERFPFIELRYRNGIVANMISKGHGDRLTEDWLTKALLQDVLDGFIEYGQALEIKDSYMIAINDMKAIAG